MAKSVAEVGNLFSASPGIGVNFGEKGLPQGAGGAEADVIADVTDLAAWSTNENAASRGGGVLFYGVGCGGRI